MRELTVLTTIIMVLLKNQFTSTELQKYLRLHSKNMLLTNITEKPYNPLRLQVIQCKKYTKYTMFTYTKEYTKIKEVLNILALGRMA
jgi:hypothetical protein